MKSISRFKKRFYFIVIYFQIFLFFSSDKLLRCQFCKQQANKKKILIIFNHSFVFLCENQRHTFTRFQSFSHNPSSLKCFHMTQCINSDGIYSANNNPYQFFNNVSALLFFLAKAVLIHVALLKRV